MYLTDQSYVCQLSSRYQKTEKYSIESVFLREYGTMFSMAPMRYPRMATKSIRYFIFFFSSRSRNTSFDCDWSSDVCSSDLTPRRSSLIGGHAVLGRLVGDLKEVRHRHDGEHPGHHPRHPGREEQALDEGGGHPLRQAEQIGRASCRERV